MNTNNLKKFAKEARHILMQGVSHRLAYWGFDENGNAVEEIHPMKDGYIFREQPFDDRDVPKKWQNLQTSIKRHSVKDVIEEAAYTWFNRLLVIKILEKNNYSSPQLEYLSSDLTDPKILTDARKGKIEYLRSNDKEKLHRYLQESDDEKAFGLLLSNYCQGNPMLKRLFGYIDDYTELLLPNNLLANDGIISLINSDEFITDDDYRQVELIGWLYQFYISDKKDDVYASFKKKKKARAEDIPAATQIFTPKWIVKYLVENTIGRIWLDKHPESPIRETMKYLVEPENAEPSEPIIDNVTELKVLDPAVGSGHFLVVAFDLLMQAYKEEGYTNRYAVESIITHNLYGLDICKRAVGLANFAILLKGASYYPDILSKDVAPLILAMPEPYDFTPQQVFDFLGETGRHYAGELQPMLEEMQQAQNIGSALVIDLTDGARDFIAKRLNEFSEKQKQGELDLLEIGLLNTLKPFLQPILMLTDAYPAVVANPPYMTSRNFNHNLSEYLFSNYKNSWHDLMTTFIDVGFNLLKPHGLQGFITLHSWLFIDDFQNFRKELLRKQKINSLIHLGRGVFGSDFGSCTFVFRKNDNFNKNDKGAFFKLFDLGKISLISNIESLEKRFHDKNRLVFQNQDDFKTIPKNTISPGLSMDVINLLNKSTIMEKGRFRRGVGTSDNNRFIRNWSEVSILKSSLSLSKSSKWFPYNKGGEFRKWYGNQDYFINWENDGNEIRNFRNSNGKLKSRPQNIEFNFQQNVSYTSLTISTTSARFYPEGFINDQAGNFLVSSESTIFYIVAYINTIVASYILEARNPTVNILIDDVNSLPLKEVETKKFISYSSACISIAKKDWDSRETSWNFEQFPLLNNSSSLSESYSDWEEKVTADFFQLHKNEEELNRFFIDIYELHDELTPDVLLKDITILQEELDREQLKNKNEELRIMNSRLPIKRDVVIKQLLSYTVGCFMGRYRLDKPGLNIAHPNPTVEELSAYITNNQHFEIDDDAIIPIMGSDSPFSDDIVFRVKKFIQTVWGEDTLTENLNFINECLGEDLEKYLTNKFWNDHKKTYKKKPIYWLFGSPDKSFQALVYMHRMNRFTIQKIRNNYLLKYLYYLNEQINRMEGNEASLAKNEAKRLDNFRKAQIEGQEYDKLMKDYADKQIEFDLDDGVTVNHAKFEGIVVKI